MATSDLRQLAAKQAELLARKAMASLRFFVEWAWPILEPATPFLPNWHIDRSEERRVGKECRL